ncbi:MAG: hypothetical protein K2G23_01980, partial [Muribaculaceae bacterium]|nr:hypothetical protein [Muribaculaceae bacterium]
MMYYPLFIVTEEESGIQSVAGNPKKGLVIVGAGRIEVVNADAVAVYDLDGRLIGTDKITYVDPGIYVVKAGDAVYKVDVK